MIKYQRRPQLKQQKIERNRNRKIPTLSLDNDDEIPAKTTYIKDTECFRINDVDINKIRIPEKKLYNKEHNAYKYYVFY